MPIITLKYLQQNARNQVLTRTSQPPGFPLKPANGYFQKRLLRVHLVNFTEMRCGCRLQLPAGGHFSSCNNRVTRLIKYALNVGENALRLTVLFAASTIFAVSKRGRDNSNTSYCWL